MLISVKKNFVFLCTPKCASSSSETMLQPFSDISLIGLPAFRHTNCREYSKFIKPYLREKVGSDDLETVCLIREPLSWLSSWYRFRARYDLRNPKHPNHQNSTFGKSFAEFVEAYIAEERPPFADVESQFSFIRNDDGEVGVEKIFVYDNIDGFVSYMSDKVGKKLKIGNQNVSPKKIYSSNFVEYIGSLKRKASHRLNLGRPVTAPKADYEIPDRLVKALRTRIAEDFDLYETLRAQQVTAEAG